MAKPVDNRYRINAMRFLILYKEVHKHISDSDIMYLFANYQCYDIDNVNVDKPRYKKKIIEMMKVFNIVVEYLDEESIENLKKMGGSL